MHLRLGVVQMHQESADAQLIGMLLNLNVALIKLDSALVIHIGML